MTGRRIGARAARRRIVYAALAIVLFGFSLRCACAAVCHVVHAGPQTEADKALLAANYARAEELYRAELAANPKSIDLTEGLVHALLHEQKVQEAAHAVDAALAGAPNTPALITLRGEVEYRQGEPWTAFQSANESLKLDPCNPRTHLLLAKLYHINSMYASAAHSLLMAHRLAPDDPEIRSEWTMTLPLHARIAELEAYLAQPSGDDENELRHLHLYLNRLKKAAAELPKPCRLASPVSEAQIPFIHLMRDAVHIRGFGLEVKINHRNARLQIDTGAGGLLVSSAVARHAGLTPFSKEELSGVGDEGSRNGYMAYADSIQIGGMEFQNCAVRVIDQKNPLDVDGLIGMDVFSQFLVTLDYPARKLSLGPLPARPGENAAAALNLKMREEDEESGGPAANPAGGAGAGAKPDATSGTPARTAYQLHDRYIAPEMADYTKVLRMGHQLILPTSLNASKIKLFILDTGAWTTTVSTPAAREVSKLHEDEDMHVTGISGEVSKVYLADAITFRFANLSQKGESVVAFDLSKLSRSNGMEISGLLGAATLNQLTIHIDYRDGLVKFDYDPSRVRHF